MILWPQCLHFAALHAQMESAQNARHARMESAENARHAKQAE
jgi:hypothetical protein